MPERITNPRRNGIATRVALLEQAQIALSQEIRQLGSRMDRFSAFVFGDDSNVDSMKSQVKQISADLQELVTSFRESEAMRKENHKRLENLEIWKKGQDEIIVDRKKEKRQYRYMLVAAVISTTVSFILGAIFTYVLARIT